MSAADEVRAAEEEAARIRAEGAEKARAVLSAAKEKAAQIREQAEKDAAAMLASGAEKNEKDARELEKSSLAAVRAEADAIAAAADKKIGAQARKIVSVIIGE